MEKEEYFCSYEDIDVHRIMLDDKPRTLAYKNAILQNKELIKDKIVMDVGCGTGILSIFCAQAGAKKVYGVEASKMAKLAKQVVEENKLSDIITIIHDRVEDVSLDTEVDVIVSEWMGFYLLHEGMLDSVITARDKFLKQDGILLPDRAELFVAPCRLSSYYDYWEDVYGVRMTCIGEIERKLRTAPVIMQVKQEDVLGEERTVLKLDLNTVKGDDLNLISSDVVTCCTIEGKLQGICLWFVCSFSTSDIIINTSPSSELTHWKQTVIVLPRESEVEEEAPLAFQLNLTRSENVRRYNIELRVLDPELVSHPIPCNCYRTKCVVIKAFLTEQEANDDDCLEDVTEEDEDAADS